MNGPTYNCYCDPFPRRRFIHSCILVYGLKRSGNYSDVNKPGLSQIDMHGFGVFGRGRRFSSKYRFYSLELWTMLVFPISSGTFKNLNLVCLLIDGFKNAVAHCVLVVNRSTRFNWLKRSISALLIAFFTTSIAGGLIIHESTHFPDLSLEFGKVQRDHFRDLPPCLFSATKPSFAIFH